MAAQCASRAITGCSSSLRQKPFTAVPTSCRRALVIRNATPPTPERQAAAPRPPAPGGPRPMPGRPGPQLPPGQIMGPDGKPLEVVPLEKTDQEEVWSSGGVARLDKGEDFDATVSNAAVLVAGDAAVLLLFSIVGRANHGFSLDAETFATALPFLVGWFAAAGLLGGFGAEARNKGAGAAAGTAAKCWAVGIPLGLVLRGIGKLAVPPVPFIAVSMGVTAVLLVGWRTALASATKPAGPISAAKRQNRKANPFEFLDLIFSMTKRW